MKADPDEVAPAGAAAGAREVDEDKWVVLGGGDPAANVSVPVAAKRHRMSAVFHAMRSVVLNVAPP